MSEDLYDYFEINKNASNAEIKKAYRKKSKKTHPDHGGSDEEFNKTNMYYMILINPLRREKYDKTGRVDEEKGEDIIEIIRKSFESVFAGIKDYTRENLIEGIKQFLNNELEGQHKIVENINSSNKNMKDMIKRIKCKKGENVIARFVESKIENNKIVLRITEERIKARKEALKYLSQYSYRVEDNNEDIISIIFGGINLNSTTTAGF